MKSYNELINFVERSIILTKDKTKTTYRRLLCHTLSCRLAQ